MIVKKQLLDAASIIKSLELVVSTLDESNLTFTVRLPSSDGSYYLLNVQFDNYPVWPLLLDFVDENTGSIGTIAGYPASKDSFFNRNNGIPFICHPSSRKAYKGYTGVHMDWGELEGWQANSQVGELKNVKGILIAIYSRLNGPLYDKHMV